MKTTDKIKSYGRLNTATIRTCAKNKALAKAMILVYIDQRANLPWVFCICDIVKQTGITEKTVKYYTKKLQAEGVLVKVPHSQYKGQMRSNMTYYASIKLPTNTGIGPYRKKSTMTRLPTNHWPMMLCLKKGVTST